MALFQVDFVILDSRGSLFQIVDAQCVKHLSSREVCNWIWQSCIHLVLGGVAINSFFFGGGGILTSLLGYSLANVGYFFPGSLGKNIELGLQIDLKLRITGTNIWHERGGGEGGSHKQGTSPYDFPMCVPPGSIYICKLTTL